MIHHNKKFIFIHIPKTAGTSIEQFFDPKHRIFYGWDKKHSLYKQHCTIKQIRDLYNVDIDSYFKFCVVRNPWARAVSDWKWWTARPASPFLKQLRNASLKDYLLSTNGFEKINHLNNENGRGDHFRAQCEFTDIDNINKMDFVLKFENLQHDWKKLCDQLNIDHDKLPRTHINQRGSPHYTEYYDDVTRKIVSQKFAVDIDRYGYQFK